MESFGIEKCLKFPPYAFQLSKLLFNRHMAHLWCHPQRRLAVGYVPVSTFPPARWVLNQTIDYTVCPRQKCCLQWRHYKVWTMIINDCTHSYYALFSKHIWQPIYQKYIPRTFSKRYERYFCMFSEKCFKNVFLGYADVQGIFHLII